MGGRPFPPLASGRFVGGRAGWFQDELGPGQRHLHRVRRVVARARTGVQDCAVVELAGWGRTLVIDGELQSSAADEFLYHESLVHPALLVQPAPRRVLILGGGEGAVLREVLRHPSVGRAVMADLDPEVLRLARTALGPWHRGSFEDPRASVVAEDAWTALKSARGGWDAVFSDLPCAARGGPAAGLYTRELFEAARSTLAPGGVFAVQTGPASPVEAGYHTVLLRTLSAVFRVVRPYYVHIPSYDAVWGFALASDAPARDPLRLTAAAADAALARRRVRGLRLIDGTTLEGLFAVPKPLREAAARERRVAAGAKRVYLYG